MLPTYHAVLPVNRETASFRGIKRAPPRENAGCRHLFHGLAVSQLTAARAVMGGRIGKPPRSFGVPAMFPSNEILHGDCTRVLKQLPDAFVDLIVTDPPYGVRYQDRFGRTVANDDDPNRILGAFTDLYRVLKPVSVLI